MLQSLISVEKVVFEMWLHWTATNHQAISKVHVMYVFFLFLSFQFIIFIVVMHRSNRNNIYENILDSYTFTLRKREREKERKWRERERTSDVELVFRTQIVFLSRPQSVTRLLQHCGELVSQRKLDTLRQSGWVHGEWNAWHWLTLMVAILKYIHTEAHLPFASRWIKTG